MNPIPAIAVLAGQLLGTAFASGLNLYATVALLGLASRFGWMAQLPPGLRGLENGLVIGSAIALFVIEFIVEKVKYAGAVWDAVHTIVRPFAAAFLAALALDTMPWEVKLAGGAASAAVALAAHSSQAGLRVMIANSRRFKGPLLISVTTLALDLLAIALAISTLLYPTAALAVVGTAIGLSILIGPRLWRAAAFGAESIVRRMRRFFGLHGWTARDRLPRAIRDAVPLPDMGRSPARGTRAVAHGIRGAGAYRTGWLVVSDDGNAFVFRSFIATRRIDLPRAAAGEVDTGPLTDALRMVSEKKPYTLFLFKDGPPAEQALAELEAP